MFGQVNLPDDKNPADICCGQTVSQNCPWHSKFETMFLNMDLNEAKSGEVEIDDFETV